VAVNGAPGALGAKEQKTETNDDEEIFDHVTNDVVRMKQFRIGGNNFPRHGGEDVDVQPQNGEEQQVHEAEAQRLAHFARVGHERQSGHERDGMKEKKQIHRKGHLGDVLEFEFGVGEGEYAGEPQRATERQQHPEPVVAAVGRGRVPQQAGVGEQRDQASEKVAKDAQLVAARKQQRSSSIAADEE
jgi:hypothetical protein